MNKINFWRFFIIGLLLTASIIFFNCNFKYNFIISYIFISFQLLYLLFLLLRFYNKKELTNNKPILKDRHKKFRLTITLMLLQLCYLFYLYFFTNKEGFAQHFFLVSLVFGGVLILFDFVMKKKEVKL